MFLNIDCAHDRSRFQLDGLEIAGDTLRLFPQGWAAARSRSRQCWDPRPHRSWRRASPWTEPARYLSAIRPASASSSGSPVADSSGHCPESAARGAHPANSTGPRARRSADAEDSSWPTAATIVFRCLIP